MSRPNNNDENYISGTTRFSEGTDPWRPWAKGKFEESWDYSEELEDKHYKHVQGTPSASWIVSHGLGKYPSVRVFDSAGTEVVGAVDYTDLNNLTITFSAAFSGEAYLN